ncbi:MAG: methyltransferase domain-containing protein [Lachnospiraceae bacterium]|nr:methyltransferase domain-containing protein [Lachnospiraceae bacterium]
MSEAYSDFAEIYDELMDATPYEEWRDRILRLIREYGVSKPVRGSEESGAETKHEGASEEEILNSERDLVVDLGCGTGTLTEMLYDAGYDMIGIDASDAMLAKAMEKREESGDAILYLQQDMRELSLYSTVGTVISACDCVNYVLEEDELLEVFSLVENYLYPGGIFIFDFNTGYKYREIIGDSVIAENREDCSFIWENFYDEESRINEYDLTMFLRREGELFERVTETHFQKGYEPSEIRSLLEKAGLEVLLMRDADEDGEVSEESQRVYVVAREHKKKAPERRLS